MKSGSRRTFLFVVIVSAVVVALAAGLSLKRPLVEQWYLWQAESGGDEEKRVALGKLQEMGSVKAIPHFLELILDAQISQDSVRFGRRMLQIYVVSDLLSDSANPADLSIPETLADLLWELARSEGERPRVSPDRTTSGDRLLVVQSPKGQEAIGKGLGILRRVHPLLARYGVAAVPELNKVMRADDAENVVKTFAEFELRMLIDDLRRREDVAALSKLLATGNLVPEMRGCVILAIGELGETAGSARPLLIKALRDENPRNRMLAADGLRAFGPGARAAIPTLRAVSQNDEAHYVRRAASDALRWIEDGNATE